VSEIVFYATLATILVAALAYLLGEVRGYHRGTDKAYKIGYDTGKSDAIITNWRAVDQRFNRMARVRKSEKGTT
jgi:hypothetical protein